MIKKLSFNTNLGWISIEEYNHKLVSIKFGKVENQGKSKYLNKVKKQILDYTIGRLKKFKVDIFLKGTISSIFTRVP